MKTETELLPCAHCGADKATQFLSGSETYVVICGGCRIRTSPVRGLPNVIAAWNRRALPAPQPGGGGEAEEVTSDYQCPWCANLFTRKGDAMESNCPNCGTLANKDYGATVSPTEVESTCDPSPTPPIALPVRAEAVKVFLNGCERTIPQALRYLAENPRPAGGCDNYNSEHLYQLADEMECAVLVAAALSRELEEAKAMLVQSQIDLLAERNAGELANRKLAALNSPRSETEGRDKERLDWLESNKDYALGMPSKKDPAWYIFRDGDVSQDIVGPSLRAVIDAALAHEPEAGE